MTMTIQQQQQQTLLSTSPQQEETQLKQQQAEAHLVTSQQDQEQGQQEQREQRQLLDRSEHSDTSLSSSSSSLFSSSPLAADAGDLDTSFHFSELASNPSGLVTPTSTSVSMSMSASFHRSILRNKNGSFSCSSALSTNHSARFSLEEPQVLLVPKHPVQEFSALFYDDEEIAQFQHEAWCEECGLDPKEFE